MGDMERAKEIANLTPSQASAIRTGKCSHEVAVSAEVYPLWTTIIKDQPGQFHIVLNRDGLAVRRILEDQNGQN